MKQACFASILFTLSAFAGLNAQQTDSLDWIITDASWEEALELAQAQDKNIIIDAYSQGCYWCTWVKKTTYPDPMFKQAIEDDFILLIADTDEEWKWFAEEYNISSYPCFFFFDKYGELLHRRGGALPTDYFIEAAEIALDPNRRLREQLIAWGDRDLKPLSLEETYQFAQSLRDARMPELGASVANEYLSKAEESGYGTAESWTIIDYFIKSYTHPHFKAVVKQQEDIIASGVVSIEYFNAFVINTFSIDFGKAAQHDDEALFLNGKTLAKELVPELFPYLEARANYYYFDDQEEAHYYANIYLIEYCDSWTELNFANHKYLNEVEDESKLNDAISWAGKAYQMEPNYNTAYSYAALLHKMGKHKEAKTYAETSIKHGKQKAADFDVSESEALLEDIIAAMQ